MKTVLTGIAGFIGFHVARALLARGDDVVGIDNVNDYYDPALKRARLAEIGNPANLRFVEADIADHAFMSRLFGEVKPERVVHLAAQAGVRYGSDNPLAYVASNLAGFVNVLEGCRRNGVGHLVYASSSSVYGANTRMPFSTADNVDHPVSLYGATKKSNELMAHSYAHLYRLPVTGLRFFTVYGPWGRPDMSVHVFTRKILAGEPIDVYNHGRHRRDFTYIDDIVEGVVRALGCVPAPDPAWNGADPDPASSTAPYRIYNIGNSTPIELLHLIECIEKAVGRQAAKNFLPLQPGDVEATFADTSGLEAAVGFRPSTPIEEGIRRFVRWYRSYHRV